MYKSEELKRKLQEGAFNDTLKMLYGESALYSQITRYSEAVDSFTEIFGVTEGLDLFSAPGRTEIGGNHTDHNFGKVLAGSVNMDIIAVAAKNDSNVIRLKSQGFDMSEIYLGDLSVHEDDIGHSPSLIRGVAAKFREEGYEIGGFDAYTTSNVLKGSGISSSAAFELLVCTVLNELYNGGRVSPVDQAKYAQYAENVHFGKPCGLLDQMAASVGGIIAIDFKDNSNPVIEKVDFNFADSGYALCIVDTGGNHADLTDEYAAIPTEMKAVARELGCTVLRETTEEEVLKNAAAIREKLGDRALIRSLHFFEENKRVDKEVEALDKGDFRGFLDTVISSGDSSFKYLQNVFACVNPAEQGISLALCLAESILKGKGAWRVHGGGFAGTTQNFVPLDMLDEFVEKLESVFGEGKCHKLFIRPVGGIMVSK
ncbi:MAG: galactokinase [Oscillospiraceae bacterium]|nr:galactokinase [Oscillospiraceae bacterium]